MASNALPGPSPDADPASDDRFRALFEQATLGMGILDRQGHVVEINAAMEALLGYPAAELCGLPFERVLHPDEHSLARQNFEALWTEGGGRAIVERCVRRRDGQVGWSRIRVSLLRDARGVAERMLLVAEDITLQKRVEAELERERAYLDQLFETTPAGIALVDGQGRIVRINQEFTRLFGYSAEEAIGRQPVELLAPPDRLAEMREMAERVRGGERVAAETVRRHRDGRLLDVALLSVLIPVPGDEVAAYAIFNDITDRKRMERALREASITDELTGLANRRGFFHLAEREWKLAGRRDEDLLLVYLDVDDFKEVNDTHGHAEGDRVLREIAELIRHSFRTTDVVARFRTATEVVARLGGDEFVVLAIGVAPGAEALLAERLQAALERYNREAGRPYTISLSLGMVRHHGGSPISVDEMLAAADHQMYAAKRAARGEG